jgi:hypothetical protein
MKDAVGNTLGIGDLIVYPGRQGSSLWLNMGEVLELDDEAGTITVQMTRIDELWSAKPTYRRTLRRPDLTILINRAVPELVIQGERRA